MNVYKDIGKRLLAILLAVAMVLGMVPLAKLLPSVAAADDGLTAANAVSNAPFYSELLANWKVQLPIARPSEYGTGVAEAGKSDGTDYVYPTFTGYYNEYFYYDPTDKAVVFYAPVGLQTTTNSSYSRSELRELSGDDKTDNWGWDDGVHTMTVTEKVTKVPSNGKIIVSQVHSIYPDGSNGALPLKITYNGANKQLEVVFRKEVNNSGNSNNYFTGVELNQEFTITIKVENHVIAVTVNSAGKTETYSYDFSQDENWAKQLNYFKAGCYLQDSEKNTDGECGEVRMYSLKTSHVYNNIGGDDAESATEIKYQRVTTLTPGKEYLLVRFGDTMAIAADGDKATKTETVTVTARDDGYFDISGASTHWLWNGSNTSGQLYTIIDGDKRYFEVDSSSPATAATLSTSEGTTLNFMSLADVSNVYSDAADDVDNALENDLVVFQDPSKSTQYVYITSAKIKMTKADGSEVKESGIGIYLYEKVEDSVEDGEDCSHSYTSTVTTAATCTTAGVRTYTCSACDESYTEEIPAQGHSYTSKVTTAATCTEAGVRTYTCQNDSSHTYVEAVPALGHNYENGTCSVCGAADSNVSVPTEATYRIVTALTDGGKYVLVRSGEIYCLNASGTDASGTVTATETDTDGTYTLSGNYSVMTAEEVNGGFRLWTTIDGVKKYMTSDNPVGFTTDSDKAEVFTASSSGDTVSMSCSGGKLNIVNNKTKVDDKGNPITLYGMVSADSGDDNTGNEETATKTVYQLVTTLEPGKEYLLVRYGNGMAIAANGTTATAVDKVTVTARTDGYYDISGASTHWVPVSSSGKYKLYAVVSADERYLIVDGDNPTYAATLGTSNGSTFTLVPLADVDNIQTDDVTDESQLVAFQYSGNRYLYLTADKLRMTKADGSDLKESAIGTYLYQKVEIEVDPDEEPVTPPADNPSDDLEDADTDNLPEYPDPGAVRLDKTATGYTFNSTGIGKVQLDVAGISQSKPVDVILIVDVSSSMAWKTGFGQVDSLEAWDASNPYKTKLDFAMDSAADFANILLGDDGDNTMTYVTFANNKADHSSYDDNFLVSTKTVFVGYDKDDLNSAKDAFDKTYFTAFSESGGKYNYSLTLPDTCSDGSWTTVNGANRGSTNYDFAFQQANEAVVALKKKISGSVEAYDASDRELHVVFMTDGAPNMYGDVQYGGTEQGGYTQFKNMVSNPTDEDWVNYLKGNRNKYAEQLNAQITELYAVGFDLHNGGFGDHTFAYTDLELVLKGLVSKSDYLDCTMAEDEAALIAFYNSLAESLVYAGTSAVVTDIVGKDYDLYTGSQGYAAADGNIQPTIQVNSYVLYNADTCGDDASLIGTRTGTSSTLETITFTTSGTTVSWSSSISGYAGSFNTTDIAVTVKGKYVTYTKTSEEEKLIWNIGNIPNEEVELSYFVHLRGAHDETVATPEKGTYPTNEQATIEYVTVDNKRATVEFPAPALPWGEGFVSVRFHLVNEQGQTVNTKGEVIPDANRISVGGNTRVTIDLSKPENLVTALSVFAETTLGDNYKLFADDGSVIVYNADTGKYMKVTANGEVAEFTSNPTTIQNVGGTLVLGMTEDRTQSAISFGVMLMPKATEYTYDFGITNKYTHKFATNTDLGNITGVTLKAVDSAENTADTGIVVEVSGDKKSCTISYTPQDALGSTVVLEFEVTYGEGEDANLVDEYVTLRTASNVLYEETFMLATGWAKTNTPDAAVNADNMSSVYGYTAAYAASTGDSGIYHADVGAGHNPGNLEFTFAGRGFDLIATCGDSTGIAAVRVMDSAGKLVKAYIVDTLYVDSTIAGNIYQVPIIHDDYGVTDTYTVIIRAIYKDRSVASASGYSMRSFGFGGGIGSFLDELYAIGWTDEEIENAQYINMSSMGGMFTLSEGDADGSVAAQSSQTTQFVEIDGFRVYRDTNLSCYDGYYDYSNANAAKFYEKDLVYTNVMEDGLLGDLIAYIEPLKNESGHYAVSDYEFRGGPENEIYLAAGQSVGFKLGEGFGQVQISARAVTGITQLGFYDGQEAKNHNIAHNTEMYYTVAANDDGIVVIMNNGDNLLALGNIKSNVALSSVDDLVEAQPVMLAMCFAMSRPAPEPENPQEPEATQPETTQPETTQPEATQPEATQPEATQPEATQPEATQPEATQPEATQPEATQPEATQPEATQPEVTEPADKNPDTSDPIGSDDGLKVVLGIGIVLGVLSLLGLTYLFVKSKLASAGR